MTCCAPGDPISFLLEFKASFGNLAFLKRKTLVRDTIHSVMYLINWNGSVVSFATAGMVANGGYSRGGWEVRISRGDQEKIMWNFQGSILVFGLGVFKKFKLNFTHPHVLNGQYQAGIELTNFKWFVKKKVSKMPRPCATRN